MVERTHGQPGPLPGFNPSAAIGDRVPGHRLVEDVQAGAVAVSGLALDERLIADRDNVELADHDRQHRIQPPLGGRHRECPGCRDRLVEVRKLQRQHSPVAVAAAVSSARIEG